MTKPKLTPWFPANVNPMRNGIYRVRPKRRLPDGCFWHAVWRDGRWSGATVLGIDKALEYDMRDIVSSEVYQWRGLAEQPKEPA